MAKPGWMRTWLGVRACWSPAAETRDVRVMGEDETEEHEVARPPVVDAGDAKIATALADGAVVAVPGVGGYCLAVRVGTPGAEARLVAMAADPDGPHYAVGQRDDVRALTSGWSDEIASLLDWCWPGPVDVFLPRALPVTETDDGGLEGVDDADDADGAESDEAADADANGSGEVRAVSE